MYPEDVTQTGISPEQICFQLLGKILTKGIIYKYGSDVSLSSLTIEELGEIRQYMKSLGYDVWLNAEIALQTKQIENKNRFLPWILKVRNGDTQFHQVMFCPLSTRPLVHE